MFILSVVEGLITRTHRMENLGIRTYAQLTGMSVQIRVLQIIFDTCS